MLIRITFIVLSLFIFVCNGYAFQDPTEIRDYYEEGKLYVKTNAWDRALKTWYSGRTALDMQGKSDPRIGIGFIELATDKHAVQYYGTASELYIWGFSNFEFTEYANEVKLEIERLLPLLPEKEQQIWRDAVDAEDARKLNNLIREFWLSRDPTPTTPGNERLIEHWERIAFARENYRKNVRMPYLTDDRGKIYVRFGKPQRTKSGSMGSNQTELLRLIPEFSSREDIRFYDDNPEYEIWVYDNLDPVKSIFFLFGNEEGNGAFKLLNGVEDLISNRARSINTERHTGFRAAYYFQMVYYNELRMMDSFFEGRYNEMDYEWSRQRGPNKNKLKDQYNLFVAENTHNPVHKFAPPEKSGFDEQFSQITVFTREARFLDNENQPSLALLAFSTPKIKGGDVKIVDKQVIKIPEFYVKHTLIVRDDDLNEIDRQEAGYLEGMANTAIFLVKEFAASTHYVIAAEALPKASLAGDSTTNPQAQTAFAIGKAVLKKPNPLSSNPDSLELSDLIFGVDFPPTIDASQLPFPIVPAQKVQNTDPARVYLEVYHLVPDEAGKGHFRLDFKIFRRGNNWEEKDRTEMIASFFDFDAPGRMSKEYFGIDLTRLARGNYELVVDVTDKASQQSKSRSVRFAVFEPKDK